MIEKGIYEHYKGQHYRVLGTARHSETLEEFVLYETLYECELGQIWVRPKAMFSEIITVNGETRPRFKYVGSPP